MKKQAFQAVALGLVFVIVYYGFQILKGMFNTMKYVPDIVESYESVDILESKVSFGASSSSTWLAVEILGLMLLGIVIYYTGRKLRRKK